VQTYWFVFVLTNFPPFSQLQPVHQPSVAYTTSLPRYRPEFGCHNNNNNGSGGNSSSGSGGNNSSTPPPKRVPPPPPTSLSSSSSLLHTTEDVDPELDYASFLAFVHCPPSLTPLRATLGGTGLTPRRSPGNSGTMLTVPPATATGTGLRVTCAASAAVSTTSMASSSVAELGGLTPTRLPFSGFSPQLALSQYKHVLTRLGESAPATPLAGLYPTLVLCDTDVASLGSLSAGSAGSGPTFDLEPMSPLPSPFRFNGLHGSKFGAAGWARLA
jgi:hypothetical protein